MPELPEVETIAEDLRQAAIIDIEIEHIDVRYPKTVATPDPKKFIAGLIGKKISYIDRRGKFIIFRMDDGAALLIHLRMSGQMRILAKEAPLNKHEHIIFYFKNGLQLRFYDPRKFGRWYLVHNPEEITGKLGPEPLSKDFKLAKFKEISLNKRRQIKPLLLDQTFLAGLGNIYVDEALWEASIHPQRLSCDLSPHEIEKLFNAIHFVLKRGLGSKGTSLGTGKSNYARVGGARGEHQTVLSVFRRTGLPCPRCGTAICRLVVAQRSSHICPTCQKAFKN